MKNQDGKIEHTDFETISKNKRRKDVVGIQKKTNLFTLIYKYRIEILKRKKEFDELNFVSVFLPVVQLN
jgi:hypothetical protein